MKLNLPIKASKLSAFCLLFWLSFSLGQAQQPSYDLKINLSVSTELRNSFKSEGRLLLFFNKNPKVEPRTQTWGFGENYLTATNITSWKADKVMIIGDTEDWTRTTEWSLANVPAGTYYVQALWDQDNEESRPNIPGNMYNKKQKLVVDQSKVLDLILTQVIQPRTVVEHKLVKTVSMKSDTLTKWWGKTMTLKASVLLPGGYFDHPDKAYPIRYNVAGYGGRYNRINRLIEDKKFTDWWLSAEAPQIITVYLDGEGPFGDSYQLDSDNNGPYGYALIHELIPYIEKQYRGTNISETRFVDGCSTGGWVSLALQLYYPDTFNGVFSYSPDAIEFENYQLINIYKDRNAYVNEYGHLRPVAREVNGEPMLILKDFIRFENALGASNTYVTSGGQFSAHTALYSPKGPDGLPVPLFDPTTGAIDSVVAERWKKYDLKLYAKKNWETLGPKLQGKIYIWMGDMDNFYLNPATRAFDVFIKTTQNPASDALIEFSPMEGHCSQFSDRIVLEKIAEKLTK
ncbi:MAG: alpha/beta hydrolase [Cyclobacteriaceae bacterium]